MLIPSLGQFNLLTTGFVKPPVTQHGLSMITLSDMLHRLDHNYNLTAVS